MAKHTVRITQVLRIERSIDIEVEAESIEDAVELQSEEDSPANDDSRWMIGRETVENETVEAA